MCWELRPSRHPRLHVVHAPTTLNLPWSNLKLKLTWDGRVDLERSSCSWGASLGVALQAHSCRPLSWILSYDRTYKVKEIGLAGCFLAPRFSQLQKCGLSSLFSFFLWGSDECDPSCTWCIIGISGFQVRGALHEPSTLFEGPPLALECTPGIMQTRIFGTSSNRANLLL